MDPTHLLICSSMACSRWMSYCVTSVMARPCRPVGTQLLGPGPTKWLSSEDQALPRAGLGVGAGGWWGAALLSRPSVRAGSTLLSLFSWAARKPGLSLALLPLTVSEQAEAPWADGAYDPRDPRQPQTGFSLCAYYLGQGPSEFPKATGSDCQPRPSQQPCLSCL